jgi:hypothetical protein
MHSPASYTKQDPASDRFSSLLLYFPRDPRVTKPTFQGDRDESNFPNRFAGCCSCRVCAAGRLWIRRHAAPSSTNQATGSGWHAAPGTADQTAASSGWNPASSSTDQAAGRRWHAATGPADQTARCPPQPILAPAEPGISVKTRTDLCITGENYRSPLF